MSDPNPDAKAIFFAALEQPGVEELADFLDRECADNAKLRGRVEDLLRAHQKAGNFLGGSVPAGETVDLPPITEKPGSQIGPYKLRQQIGSGGMGVVYIAEQKEPVKRRVALKIIKPGMDSQQVIARFEAERQALALMDHPNIAKVLDAGTTDSGRPYFVMELANGVSITEYCDQHHLTPRKRLELMVPIFKAVQHAHQKGIIHRDLKPSNILVPMYDGRPVPKVIDFGVAKATSQALTEKSIFTQLGQIVGTLDYMSPEQADQNHMDIDTRSDIYSLGVVVYELLTGETPFDRKRLRSAGFDEMLRIIREEEPPKPSTKLSSSEKLPSIAAQRKTEPAKLGSLVRGELDWIVLKALEKDRARRYETASAFAEDVQRYLRDEPVSACPPSRSYLLRKFARRNWTTIVMSSVVVVLLVGGIAGTSWQAFHASQQRDRAQLAEVKAGERLEQALDAVDQMLLRVGDIRLENVPLLTEVRGELLKDAIRFYEEFLQEQPDDPHLRFEKAKIKRRLAAVLTLQGKYDQANNAISDAIKLIDQDLAERNGDSILLVEQARNYVEASRCDAKERRASHLEAAVEIYEKLANADKLQNDEVGEFAFTLSLLALRIRDVGEFDTVKEYFEMAEARFKEASSRDPANRLLSRNWARHLANFGNFFTDNGQLGQAEEKYKKSLQISRRLADEGDQTRDERFTLASAVGNLGTNRFRQQQLEAADILQDEAIEMMRHLVLDFPSIPRYRLRLTGFLMNKANTMYNKGSASSAIPVAEEAAKLTSLLTESWPNLAEYHSLRGGALSNLAMMLNGAEGGDPGRAEEFALQAIRHQRRALEINPDGQDSKVYLLNHFYALAMIRAKLGRPSEARETCVEAIQHGEQLLEQFPRNRAAKATLNMVRQLNERLGSNR